MEEAEQQAADRVRALMQSRREKHGIWMYAKVEDVGLLLCAVGRLDFMESTCDTLADSPVPDIAATAKAIRGWEGEKSV